MPPAAPTALSVVEASGRRRWSASWPQDASRDELYLAVRDQPWGAETDPRAGNAAILHHESTGQARSNVTRLYRDPTTNALPQGLIAMCVLCPATDGQPGGDDVQTWLDNVLVPDVAASGGFMGSSRLANVFGWRAPQGATTRSHDIIYTQHVHNPGYSEVLENGNSLRAIAEGYCDANIIADHEAIRAAILGGQRVRVRRFHEFTSSFATDGSTSMYAGYQAARGDTKTFREWNSATDHVRAWRRMNIIARTGPERAAINDALAANPAEWGGPLPPLRDGGSGPIYPAIYDSIWNPHRHLVPNQPWNDPIACFPGNDEFGAHAIAQDIYSVDPLDVTLAKYRGPSEMYDFAVSVGLPYGIAETGTRVGNKNPDALQDDLPWWQDYVAWMLDLPNFEFLFWFQRNPTDGDSRIQNSPNARSVMRTFCQNPRVVIEPRTIDRIDGLYYRAFSIDSSDGSVATLDFTFGSAAAGYDFSPGTYPVSGAFDILTVEGAPFDFEPLDLGAGAFSVLEADPDAFDFEPTDLGSGAFEIRAAPTRPPSSAEDRRAEAVIILRRPDGEWTTVGTDEARGIVPQAIRASAGPWGPESLSFTLARESGRDWPDLAAFNQAELVVDGLTVWGGRIWKTPGGGRNTISVEGRGWHHHLDDDQVDAYFVLADLSVFKDLASIPGVPLGGTAGAHVGARPSIGGGDVTLGIGDAVAFGASQKIGVQLDLGEVRRAKRIVLEWESSNNTPNIVVAIRGHDAVDPDSGSPEGTTIALDAGASGTYSGTLTTARRYVSVYLVMPGTAGTTGAEHFFRIKRIVIVPDTDYETGGYSALRGSQVVAWVPTSSGAVPLLSSSTARIQTSGLIDGGTRGIPELFPSGYQAARELLEAANAYHVWDLGVTPEREIRFRPLPSVPIYEIGEWSGAEDPSEGVASGEDVYNRVIVEGTGPDGEPLRVVRTIASALLARQGFTRTHRLSVQAAGTEAAFETIGDAWLAERSRTRFAGSTTVARGDVRRIDSGETPHPSRLLRDMHELVRFSRMQDPDTGAIGRDGRILGVEYSHDAQTASVSVDSRSGLLEPILARWGAIAGQVR